MWPGLTKRDLYIAHQILTTIKFKIYLTSSEDMTSFHFFVTNMEILLKLTESL